MSCRRGIVLIALGVSCSVSEAGPETSGECRCLSACAKSWHGGGSEWCYVGKQCSSTGSRSCDATQWQEAGKVMLHSESNVKEKQVTESKSLWQRLQDQLKAATSKEVEEESALKVAEKEVKQEKERSLEEEAALAVAEAKLKKSQETESELKASAKHEAAEKAELDATKAALKTSETKVEILKKQLRSALEKETTAEQKAQAAEIHEKKAAEIAAQKQAEGEKAYREAQIKLHQADAKWKEEHAKVMTWEATHKKDKVTHEKDALKLSDTELRLSGKEKELLKSDKKAKVAYTKFKATEKTMLKVKTQASDAEKKLAASISENAKLKDVEKKYVDVQKKLDVAVKQKNKAWAELKPFRDAVRKAVLA